MLTRARPDPAPRTCSARALRRHLSLDAEPRRSVAKKEDFRTLYCDPGEDFGWCVGVGLQLISRGIEKMWETVDQVGDEFEYSHEYGIDTIFSRPDPYGIDGVDPKLFELPVKRIVCEDFRIYPWKIRELKF